jgi:hypothetical protein
VRVPDFQNPLAYRTTCTHSRRNREFRIQKLRVARWVGCAPNPLRVTTKAFREAASSSVKTFSTHPAMRTRSTFEASYRISKRQDAFASSAKASSTQLDRVSTEPALVFTHVFALVLRRAVCHYQLSSPWTLGFGWRKARSTVHRRVQKTV